MSQVSPENRHPENQAAMSEEDLAALRQLHRVIDEEMRKPLEEQDEELISECIETIAEIKGVKGSFSAEEIDEQIAIVKAKAAQEKAARQPKRIRKPVLIAACAVLLVAVSIITVYANPTLRAWFEQIRQLPAGSSVAEQGVTYTYMGNTKMFNSMEELLEVEGISIYYPVNLPSNIYITSIVCLQINDELYYTIGFNTTDISIRIQSGDTYIFEPTDGHQVYTTPISTFYISDEDNITAIKTIINSNLYYITVNNSLDYKNILDNLKESAQ